MPTTINLDRETGIIQHTRMDEFAKLPVLIPTTNDVFDSLNWSSLSRNTQLSLLCASLAIANILHYCSCTILHSFAGPIWCTCLQINWNFAILALGLAAGPLFCSALADIYGRQVVMIIGTTVALISSAHPSMEEVSGLPCCQVFQGFGIGPAANVGLSTINDILWEHERGFRIGL